MNRTLLRTLNIDENMSLSDILEALDECYGQCIDRLDYADDTKRAELENTMKLIEAEIAEVKAEIASAKSAIIFNDSSAEEATETAKKAAAEKAAAEKAANAAKVEAMRNKRAADLSENRDSTQTNGSDAGSTGTSGDNGSSGAPGSTTGNTSAPTGGNKDAGDNSNSGGASSSGKGNASSGMDYAHALLEFKKQNYKKAFPTIKREAEAGNSDAQHVLGAMYLGGHGVDEDHSRAEFWFEQAANAGNDDAVLSYASLVLYGEDRSVKRRTKALAMLEQAADRDHLDSMKKYIDVCSESNFYHKKRYYKRAKNMCKRIAEISSDPYERSHYKKDRPKELKSRWKSTKGGCLPSFGCGCSSFFWGLIILSILFAVVSGIVNKFADDTPGSDKNASANLTPGASTAPLGTRVLELHKLTATENARITDRAGDGYELDGESWDGAFIYRAGNGDPTAYANYALEGKFERLEFHATPVLDQGEFFTNSRSEISVINLDTGDYLYSKTIGCDAEVLEVSVDVTGVKNVQIAVTLKNDILGYVYIKDAYIYPVGMWEGGAVAYTVTANANIRAGAGTNYDVISTATAGDVLQGTGNTTSDWYEVRLEDGTIGWIHNSLAKRKDK